jgi:hypothetical protein
MKAVFVVDETLAANRRKILVTDRLLYNEALTIGFLFCAWYGTKSG